MHSRLPKLKKVAKSLSAHLSGLLTYFGHRITNALTEGFNSKIQALKADARGFRRFENYRTRTASPADEAPGRTLTVIFVFYQISIAQAPLGFSSQNTAVYDF